MITQPVLADDDLKPALPVVSSASPVKTPGYWDRHPLLFKAAYPVRKTWRGCVWVGNKSQPIHPFLNLCGALGSMAGPFVYGFAAR
jgi:hypothetical protein